MAGRVFQDRLGRLQGSSDNRCLGACGVQLQFQRTDIGIDLRAVFRISALSENCLKAAIIRTNSSALIPVVWVTDEPGLLWTKLESRMLKTLETDEGGLGKIIFQQLSNGVRPIIYELLPRRTDDSLRFDVPIKHYFLKLVI